MILLKRRPGFHRDMAVGLGRELQDDLGGVDVGLGSSACPSSDAFVGAPAVQPAELLALASVFQAMPLPPSPILFISGSERR